MRLRLLVLNGIIAVINDGGTQRAGVIPYSVDNAPSQTEGTVQFVNWY